MSVNLKNNIQHQYQHPMTRQYPISLPTSNFDISSRDKYEYTIRTSKTYSSIQYQYQNPVSISHQYRYPISVSISKRQDQARYPMSITVTSININTQCQSEWTISICYINNESKQTINIPQQDQYRTCLINTHYQYQISTSYMSFRIY